jgi:hypothetical protein
MTDPGDDELERRLRDVLHSRGLGVPVPPDAIDRIHTGAHRRQRRRMAASATAAAAAVAVVAVAAIGVGLRPAGRGSTVVAASSSPVASPTASPVPLPLIVSGSPGVVSSPPVAASSEAVFASTPPTPVFNPVSVSAISVNDYWVLGYTQTGVTSSTTVMKTTNAGKTFTTVGSPAAIIATFSRGPRGSNTKMISDIRFGDANNGWAYGDNLFATTDGGTSWSEVTGMPDAVVDLVASNGVAWALVDLSAGAASSTPSRYALYSTPYGNGVQRWARVQLPIDLGATQPSIVDQDGTVTVVASGPARSSNLDHALVATKGGAFSDHVGPCSQDLGGDLSNSASGIWAVCPTGSLAGVAVSSDRGATWTSVPNLPPPSFPNPGAGGVGAIDSKHAVLSDLATGGLLLVTVGGSPVQITSVQTSVGAGTEFIGFTTPSDGFAIVPRQPTPSQLWRTTDGGQIWSVVNLGS